MSTNSSYNILSYKHWSYIYEQTIIIFIQGEKAEVKAKSGALRVLLFKEVRNPNPSLTSRDNSDRHVDETNWTDSWFVQSTNEKCLAKEKQQKLRCTHTEAAVPPVFKLIVVLQSERKWLASAFSPRLSRQSWLTEVGLTSLHIHVSIVVQSWC